jgi:hypothetical protein
MRAPEPRLSKLSAHSVLSAALPDAQSCATAARGRHFALLGLARFGSDRCWDVPCAGPCTSLRGERVFTPPRASRRALQWHVPAGEQARAGMSPLPMLPAACQPLRLACRDRMTRAALLRRSMRSRWATMPVSMPCELLDLHANRTGQNTARHATFYIALMNRWVRQRCLVLDTEPAWKMV